MNKEVLYNVKTNINKNLLMKELKLVLLMEVYMPIGNSIMTIDLHMINTKNQCINRKLYINRINMGKEHKIVFLNRVCRPYLKLKEMKKWILLLLKCSDLLLVILTLLIEY